MEGRTARDKIVRVFGLPLAACLFASRKYAQHRAPFVESVVVEGSVPDPGALALAAK